MPGCLVAVAEPADFDVDEGPGAASLGGALFEFVGASVQGQLARRARAMLRRAMHRREIRVVLTFWKKMERYQSGAKAADDILRKAGKAQRLERTVPLEITP